MEGLGVGVDARIGLEIRFRSIPNTKSTILASNPIKLDDYDVKTMKSNHIQKYQSGQMLIMLIIYMVVAVIITTASISMLVITSQSAEKLSQGSNALDIAESGAETAMIKLLRDPSYTGETLTISDGQAVVTVTGTNPKVIVSEGIRGNFRRKIQVSADYTNNVLTVSSWQELP